MRTRLLSLALVVVLAAAAFVAAAPRAVQAQDGMIVCDSTLITLLYVAEHDYGFKPSMDVSTFEKGQFKPLFDAMMAMMESMEATPEATMEGEGGMMESTPDASMVMLTPGVVQGENESCTKLRAEVETFLLEKFKSSMMK